MALKKTVLVIGATGQQGGAVARQLLENGWMVRVLARDPHKQVLQLLRDKGAEIVQGDLDDPSSVKEAMKGVYGVFSVQALHLDDLQREVRHGIMIADAAHAESVSHFVYSSAGGADRNTGITSFENKGKIERHIRSLHLPATILRPVMFMDNFRFFLQPVNGQINIPYIGAPETKVQMIAVHDIGSFAAIAFGDPENYINTAMELAGDELTYSQIIETISKVFDLPVQYLAPPAVPDQDNEHDGTKANAFFEKEGYRANIESLRKIHPQLLNFESWLRRVHS